MVEYHLWTPLSEKDVRKLKIRDVVYISGVMFTARDSAHERALEYFGEGRNLPIDTNGVALFHSGPLVREVDGRYEVVSAGPTTSARMEVFEEVFIEKSGIRIIIGKGGMGAKTVEAMKKFGVVYCAFTGGTGALAAKAIKAVKSVEWLDLGMPEALWTLVVEDFGPLIVAIDSFGNNLYANVMDQVEKNRLKIHQSID
ncbi:MAG: fumarate hydratase subunit beta [Thermoproteota archaeon]|nr:fumarate hydratase subunit beta [Thermoproteota archaeon]